MSNICSNVVEALAALRVQRAAILADAATSLSPTELLEVLAEDERATRSAPTAIHPILNRLLRECSPHELGGTSLPDLLSRRLVIGKGVAAQRLADAQVLGPRTGLTGEPLAPLWAGTAAGQAAGEIGPEQLKIIRTFMKALPSGVDYQAREDAEHALASIARGLQPTRLHPRRRPLRNPPPPSNGP